MSSVSPIFRFVLALLALLLTGASFADPPARVGRISMVDAGVNLRVDRSDPGSQASLNWPISSGALLETEPHRRAEIWVGSTAFRVGGGSQLEFPALDDRQVLAQLAVGGMTVSILDREQVDDVLVQTPDGRISFTTPGRYRIDVFADHTELSAQAGRAQFNNGQRGYPVTSGQKGSFATGAVSIKADNDQDAFDHWVSQRENMALASDARRYVSPAMTGYQDLDRYGEWQTQGEYGAVWYPRAVADDWAPYRYGRWAWVPPWGWTWVDEAPWGFAPFHYGRWVRVHERWGWVPGTYVARPVYAPALVAWIGNPGWNVSFSFGSAPAVGWFPLGPREVYVPGYRVTPAYVRHVNASDVRDHGRVDRALHGGPPPVYQHRVLPQAVTVVPATHLHQGHSIRPGEIARPDRRELERAPRATARPDPAVLPPANRPAFRDERPNPQAGQPMPARANGEFRDRQAVPPPFGGRDDNRRSQPNALPPAAVPLPGRPQEPARTEPERRPPAIQAGPATPQPAVGRPPEGFNRPAPGPDANQPPRDFQRNRPIEQDRRAPPPTQPTPLPAAAPMPMPQTQPQVRPNEPINRPSAADLGRDFSRQEREMQRPRDVPPVVAPQVMPAPGPAPQPQVQPQARPIEPFNRPSAGNPGREFQRQDREMLRPRDVPPVAVPQAMPAPVPVPQPQVQPQARPSEPFNRPPAANPGRDFQHQEREMQRPREVPQAPPVVRAPMPMPQAAPPPAPVPAAVPPGAGQRPPEPPRGGNPDKRREHGDERGPH